jgi:DNA polymerase-3 subunit delta
MKLNGRDAIRYFAQPDQTSPAILIHGAEALKIADRRQQITNALVGENASQELRLTRLHAAEVRKDPAVVIDSIKEVGFFPGKRAVVIEGVGDGLTATFQTALDEWRDGDATLVITAGILPARSKLRKLFEGHRSARAAGVYAEPPSRDEVIATLKHAGITDVSPEAETDIMALARVLEPGDLKQTIEKLALYKLSDATPVSSDDVRACGPAVTEAALDTALDFLADANTPALGSQLRRLADQGFNPTTICIGATRHFRNLHQAASDPGGPEAALGRLRPPVFGPRRDKMIRQSKKWGVRRLERVLSMLTEADLNLRSSHPGPQTAMLERALIRISMMGSR